MRVARVFFDIDMRNGMPGLSEFLKKNDIDTRGLGTGDFIVFVNRRCSAFKVLVGNNYIVHHNHKSLFPLESLAHLPTAFGGGEFDFSKAVKTSLLAKLKLKQ